MKVVVINIGNPAYAEPAEEVLTHYFSQFVGVSLTFLREDPPQNVKKAHPSWLKLLLHEIYDDPFIIAWDLDMLPLRNIGGIFGYFDQRCLNMAVDSSLLAGFPGFVSSFKYNGGLIGIPKRCGTWLSEIYRSYAPGVLPSYEQYYLGNALAMDSIPVHELPPCLNTLYPKNDIGRSLWSVAKVRHYTFGVIDDKEKAKLIQEHRDEYFKGGS